MKAPNQTDRGQSVCSRGKKSLKAEIVVHIVHCDAHDNTIVQSSAVSPAKNGAAHAVAPQKLQTRLIWD